MELREWLMEKGYEFKSETDTEVIPNLVDFYYKGDLLKAVMEVTKKLEGSYAIGVIAANEPDKLVAVRNESPLIVGLGEDENFIASDIPAVLNQTRKVYLLEDKEFVVMTKDGIKIYDQNEKEVKKEVFNVTWDADAAKKGGYDHFMMKEIHEQPKAIRDTMASRIIPGQPIRIDDITITKEQIEKLNKVYIVACGTAYHAGLVGKNIIEKLARIQVEVDIASEFKYRDPIIDENTLMIVVSQSGETADTMSALRLAKKRGARVIAVTNVVGSSASREADDILYTWAGPEIAVASTKAYVTQLIAMYTIALFFAEQKSTVPQDKIEAIKTEMLALPEKAEAALKCDDAVKALAAKTCCENNMFFLGRGLDHAVAMEGSLKLKEISYIHSEAYASGELIEEGTVVVTMATQEDLFDKTVSNMKEVIARGARVFAVAQEGHTDIEKSVESAIYIPKVMDLLAPVIAIIPMQLFFYYMSMEKGCDVDKPRNLAKSVTVE